MRSSPILPALLFLLLILPGSSGRAQRRLFPLQPGEAVVTCFSGYNRDNSIRDDFVMGIIDVRNPPVSRLGVNWNAPMYHGPNGNWTSENLGQVFGVTIDSGGSIYVTATSSYGHIGLPVSAPRLFGPGGAGGVYRIDGVTGAISVIASLPNSGPALGNISYDERHNQLMVTNFEDGKIYRLDTRGTVLGMHDPYLPDDGSPGFAPQGERLWGIGVYEDRVYYSVWWEDILRAGLKRSPGNEIRSVALDGDGAFIPSSDRHEVWLPPLTPEVGFSSPASSINFSTGGRMLVAERSMRYDDFPDAHLGHILEYRGVPGNWGDPVEFPIGYFIGSHNGHENTAGSADYGYESYDEWSGVNTGCDSVIWGTGDALMFPDHNPDGSFDRVYGMARLPASGSNVLTLKDVTYYIDFDGDLNETSKTGIGAVKIFRSCSSVTPPPPPPPPDTTGGADTVTICEGDTATLSARIGVLYRWTPAAGLSCADCRTLRVAPAASAAYIATVRDTAGGVSIDTFVVIVTARRSVSFLPGSPYAHGRGLLRMPVYLSDPAGAPFIAHLVLTLRYRSEHLWLRSTPASAADSMVLGTAARGWDVIASTPSPGELRLELSAPPGAAPLRHGDTLLHLDFLPLLSEVEQSTIEIGAIIPDLSCIDVEPGSRTIITDICGADNRLIESTGPAYGLAQNDPNPCRTTTTISFTIALEGRAKLEIFDKVGRLVATPLDREMEIGSHSVVWDCSKFPAGIYFYRLTSGGWSETREVGVER